MSVSVPPDIDQERCSGTSDAPNGHGAPCVEPSTIGFDETDEPDASV